MPDVPAAYLRIQRCLDVRFAELHAGLDAVADTMALHTTRFTAIEQRAAAIDQKLDAVLTSMTDAPGAVQAAPEN
ncbi:hypothetical protein [Filomicrobium sp.]|uniref:hypothetical protein n=1 Tax=Filomicrobium sp. TaxID=2024831 RepID=UPI002588D36F|nr:hypothetical protein [Filomicrobium sp.]MCV0369533.1 hypothetical protein [Filomicrobium sp.]